MSDSDTSASFLHGTACSLNIGDADHVALFSFPQGCVLLRGHVFVVIIKHLKPSECLKGFRES